MATPRAVFFKLGKNARETYGMLQTAFGASSMNGASVFEWHKKAGSLRGMMRGVAGVIGWPKS